MMPLYKNRSNYDAKEKVIDRYIITLTITFPFYFNPNAISNAIEYIYINHSQKLNIPRFFAIMR